jgi:hypothetical protein
VHVRQVARVLRRSERHPEAGQESERRSVALSTRILKRRVLERLKLFVRRVSPRDGAAVFRSVGKRWGLAGHEVFLAGDELEQHDVVVGLALVLQASVILRVADVHGGGERHLARVPGTSPSPAEHRGGALQLPRAVRELHQS